MSGSTLGVKEVDSILMRLAWIHLQNVDVVFAEPELLANCFLDCRAAEHFA